MRNLWYGIKKNVIIRVLKMMQSKMIPLRLAEAKFWPIVRKTRNLRYSNKQNEHFMKHERDSWRHERDLEKTESVAKNISKFWQ